MLPSSLLHSESTEMGSSPRRHYRLYWPLMVFVLQRQYVVFIRQWKFVHAYSIYAFEWDGIHINWCWWRISCVKWSYQGKSIEMEFLECENSFSPLLFGCTMMGLVIIFLWGKEHTTQAKSVEMFWLVGFRVTGTGNMPLAWCWNVTPINLTFCHESRTALILEAALPSSFGFLISLVPLAGLYSCLSPSLFITFYKFLQMFHSPASSVLTILAGLSRAW